MLKIIPEPAGACAVRAEAAHAGSAGCANQLCQRIGPCAQIKRQLTAEIPVGILIWDHSQWYSWKEILSSASSLIPASAFWEVTLRVWGSALFSLLVSCVKGTVRVRFRWSSWWTSGYAPRSPGYASIPRDSILLCGACLTSSMLLCLCSNVIELRPCRLSSSGPFLQGHPITRKHKMGWHPKPQLSSGCLQEKFGGPVTQFFLHCVFKAKENFGATSTSTKAVPEENDSISQQPFRCSWM